MKNSTTVVNIEETIRPIKIGFIVDTNKGKSLQNAIYYSSILWGGINNILIPFYGKSSKKSVYQKCIDLILTTKPDFIINLTNYKVPTKITELYKANFILSHDNFITRDGEEIHFNLGIRSYPILNAFLNKIEQNKLDSGNTEFVIYSKDSEIDLSLMANCGYLSNSNFSKLLIDKFPTHLISTYSQFSKKFKENYTPLQIGSWNIKSMGNNGALMDAIIFVGESQNKLDIVEFWNIRACGRNAIFIPFNNAIECSEMINQFISENYYPINDNGVFNATSIIKGESLDRDNFIEVLSSITNTENKSGHKFVFQAWIPGWNEPSSSFIMKQIICPTFYQKIYSDIISSINGVGISFNLQYPDFLSDEIPYRYQKPYFVVDISVNSYSQEEKTYNIPLVSELYNTIKYRVYSRHDEIKMNGDKISIFADKIGEYMHISSVEVMEVFREYFKSNGISINFSKPGIIANKIISHMGGNIDYCRILKLRGVRELLKELSTEIGSYGSEERKKSKKTIKEGKNFDTIQRELSSKHSLGSDYYGIVHSDKYKQNGIGIFNKLYDNNILRPGLLFECENCQKNDWYGIEEFQKEFSCRHCFHKQKVLLTNGNSDKKWMYKPNGLFALPDGGQGSIATILSLWYLNHFGSLSSNKLLLTSVDCKIEGRKDPVECDFCVFHENEMIIGEAKNLTELQKSDFDKVLLLGKALKTKPILCFSTLKDEFSDKEKGMLKSVISQGFLILPLTRLDTDPYDVYERFENSKHKYPNNIRELAENLYSLNLDIDTNN